jgi:hypothetical protein
VDERGSVGPSSPGFDKELVVVLDTAGLWAVNCFNTGSSGADYPATVFVVTDS